MNKCRCSINFCECIETRIEMEGYSHCFQCPESEKLIGGGLECYGIYEGQKSYRDEKE